MEIKYVIFYFVSATALVSCTTMAFDVHKITEVYVADFNSEAIQSCRPSDVDLSHSQARDFFIRAKRVDKKTLHDHYNHAPCYIEGTLKYSSKPCGWEIRAGATGQVTCSKVTEYFACDSCNDLFKTKSAP